MASIVLHKPTGQCYVLLGTGFGAYKSSAPSFLGGNLFPNEDYGEVHTAALSDSLGQVVWLPTEELQVLEVDGKSPGEWLRQSPSEGTAPGTEGFPEASDRDGEAAEDYEHCPACGHRVQVNQMQCPSCELTLIMKEKE